MKEYIKPTAEVVEFEPKDNVMVNPLSYGDQEVEWM